MKMRILLLFFFLIALKITANASDGDSTKLIIKGRVFDQKSSLPLSFCKIILRNLRDTVQADFDGNYKFEIYNLPDSVISETIIVSYLGYFTSQIQLDNLSLFKDADQVIRFNNINLGLNAVPVQGCTTIIDSLLKK
jgi:hypothetical protein